MSEFGTDQQRLIPVVHNATLGEVRRQFMDAYADTFGTVLPSKAAGKEAYGQWCTSFGIIVRRLTDEGSSLNEIGRMVTWLFEYLHAADPSAMLSTPRVLVYRIGWWRSWQKENADVIRSIGLERACRRSAGLPDKPIVRAGSFGGDTDG